MPEHATVDIFEPDDFQRGDIYSLYCLFFCSVTFTCK